MDSKINLSWKSAFRIALAWGAVWIGIIFLFTLYYSLVIGIPANVVS